MTPGNITDGKAGLNRLGYDASFCSVVERRRRATPVITSTFENVSDIGLSLGQCLGSWARARVRSKRGAVHGAQTGVPVGIERT